jgi:hypothetical protein
LGYSLDKMLRFPCRPYSARLPFFKVNLLTYQTKTVRSPHHFASLSILLSLVSCYRNPGQMIIDY